MTKIIKIKSCKLCPFCHDGVYFKQIVPELNRKGTGKDVCFLKKIEVGDYEKIADFCPLEDYQPAPF